MKKNKNSIVLSKNRDVSLIDEISLSTRKGIFEQGHDKLGRPYEKKLDNNGIYTKKEILKDGTRKLTIKEVK